MIGKFADCQCAVAAGFNNFAGRARLRPGDRRPGKPAPHLRHLRRNNPPRNNRLRSKPPSDQEPAEEESSSRRKAKPHDYKNWNYNVGLGANVDSGTTKTFVRGGGGVATAGVARNANKYLGLRADFIFADLPLRDSTCGWLRPEVPPAIFSPLRSDPVINIPVTKLWGGYILFGPGLLPSLRNLEFGHSCSGFVMQSVL